MLILAALIVSTTRTGQSRMMNNEKRRKVGGARLSRFGGSKLIRLSRWSECGQAWHGLGRTRSMETMHLSEPNEGSRHTNGPREPY